MKPFITPKIEKSGRKIFGLQCENIHEEDLHVYLQSLSIVGYALPKNQSFREAWIFQLIFNNNTALEFSSASTMVDGWEEVGSLNVNLINYLNNKILINETTVSFGVECIEKLTYICPSFESECGLNISGQGHAFLISTGVSPGSVSILSSFLESTFCPEFPVADCVFKNLKHA